MGPVFLYLFPMCGVGVRVIGQGQVLGLGFTFCVYYVFTKPTAISSCVTVMLPGSRLKLNMVSNIKIHRRFCSHCLNSFLSVTRVKPCVRLL